MHAISDYFEDSWNNICKYDRSPFMEIHRLDVWHYMVVDSVTDQVHPLSWKKIERKILYTEKNPEEFKKEFFDILDFYLRKIHEKEDKLAFSISSGTDANTLAARYTQLFGGCGAVFVTSKIDDETDESLLTSSMQNILPSKIHYVDINSDQSDFMSLLLNYMEKHLPPRFFNEVNENVFLKGLKSHGLDYPNVNGMNADGVFGEMGNEYRYLFQDLMKKKEWSKAKNVLTAIKVSFPKGNQPTSRISLDREFRFWKVLYDLHLGGLVIPFWKRISGTRRKYSVLKVTLPIPASRRIKTYEDALEYASYSGEQRALKFSYELEGTRLWMPYGGYRFQKLKYACSPDIFADKVNKSCLRKAVSDLLPKEILQNHIKRGNPGVTLKKVMKNKKNISSVRNYLEKRKYESNIVNTEVLLKHLEKNFGTKDFLALCLLIFEDKIRNECGSGTELLS